MVLQLPLVLDWQNEATFDNFYRGDNARVVAYLQDIWQGSTERFIYLYGMKGAGLSHLLKASCQWAVECSKTTTHLSLTDLELKTTDSIRWEELETLDLICLDSIEALVGNSILEEHLFHLYNRLALRQTRLIMAGSEPIKQFNWHLPDLASRLAACVAFQVKPLTDEEKILALRQRAKHRGLELPLEVGQFLLNHFPRDMSALFNVLERLDVASLAAQRKLTVPFVRKVLG